MSHDLAAVRESVEQLAAGQEQIARDIAKLQMDGQDMRRRIPALPPAATTARKPVPPATRSSVISGGAPARTAATSPSVSGAASARAARTAIATANADALSATYWRIASQ
jgi:hypothetical protein